jgi:predicted amidohydrolase
MIVRIAALQYTLGRQVTLEDKLFIIRRRPDFICLPEYCFIGPDCTDMQQAASAAARNTALLEKLSVDLSTTIIGGSIVMPTDGGYANTAMIFSRGRLVGSYQKINLYGNEPRRGILPGKNIASFEIDGVRIGVLICADVLNENSFRELHKKAVDIIFVPTTSPHRPEDTLFDKQLRDNEIFVRGAQRANAYVVKAGGVGTLFGRRLQGRSGIFAPWGVLAKVKIEDEDRRRILFAELDLDEIREFKQKMVFTAPVPALDE